MTALNNRRGLSRNNIEHSVALIDKDTGKTLGKLVNIHKEGLMVISQAEVLADNLYQATLITNDETIDPIHLGLDCMWLRELEQGEGCWAGFRIISISEQAMEKIELLVQQFGGEINDPST